MDLNMSSELIWPSPVAWYCAPVLVVAAISSWRALVLGWNGAGEDSSPLLDFASKRRPRPTTSIETRNSTIVEVLDVPHLLIEVILRVPKLTPNLGIAQARSCDWGCTDLGSRLQTTIMRESVLKHISWSNSFPHMIHAAKHKERNHVRSEGDGLLIVDAGRGDDLQVDVEARLERTVVDVISCVYWVVFGTPETNNNQQVRCR